MKPHDAIRAPKPSSRWTAIALFILVGAITPLLALRINWTLDENQLIAGTQELPEGDFSNIWAGGRLALDGRVHDIFDIERYRGWFIENFGPNTAHREWSYPPTMLLVGLPFALLPLLTAALTWIFGSAAALALVLRRARISWPTVLATVLSPGALVSVYYGQTGAATAALFISGLMFAGSNPIAAGIMIGLLTVKPQMGLLIPICLIAGGHFRAFIAAAITAAIMLAATGLLFGWDLFELYRTTTHPMMMQYLEQAAPEGVQVNEVQLFLTLRALGASLQLAYAVQIAAAVAAAIGAWFLWRRPMVDPMEKALRVGLTGCLALMTSPYIHSYDMVVYSFALALLFERSGWRLSPLLLLCWIWPDFVNVINRTVFPISPIIIITVIAWIALALLRPPPERVDAAERI